MSTPFAPPVEETRTAAGASSGPAYLLEANASLGRRFVGAFIDMVIPNAAGIAAMVVFSSLSDDPYFLENGSAELVAAPPIIIYSMMNWLLISWWGQSIGKMMVGTRIVRTDGSPVGFADGVMIRGWAMAILSVITCRISGLVDPLFIFSPERQCLHDHLADTMVVDASFDPYRTPES